MTLIAITLALIIERLIGSAHLIHNFSWLHHWAKFLEKRLPKNTPAALIFTTVVLPLLLLIYLLELYFGAYLWGLSGFILHVLVLSACLGPRLLDQDIDEYSRAREKNDREKLIEAVKNITGKAVPSSFNAEVREVAQGIFYQANIRWYAVIFWFLALGPMGAAAYRLTILLRKDEYAAGDFSRKVYGLLGWVPARISALYFGFMGSLDDAWQAFQNSRKSHLSWAEGNQLVLSHTGCAAINMEMSEAQESAQELTCPEAIKWVSRAKGLCLKVLVLWMATVAVFTLFGWMV